MKQALGTIFYKRDLLNEPFDIMQKTREEKRQKQLFRYGETLSRFFELAPRIAHRVSSRAISQEGWKRRIRETGIEK